MFWTAFWARVGWELVPIAIILSIFVAVFAGCFAYAAWHEFVRKWKRRV